MTQLTLSDKLATQKTKKHSNLISLLMDGTDLCFFSMIPTLIKIKMMLVFEVPAIN